MIVRAAQEAGDELVTELGLLWIVGGAGVVLLAVLLVVSLMRRGRK